MVIIQLDSEQLSTVIQQAVRRVMNESPVIAGDQEEEILSIQQAADFLRLTVPTLYTLNSKGEVPSCKRGKRLYFSKADLVNWVKEGRRKTVSEIDAEAGSYLIKKGGRP